MTSLGFENYSEALKIYLSRYREVSCHFFLPPPPLSFLCCLLFWRKRLSELLVLIGGTRPSSQIRTSHPLGSLQPGPAGPTQAAQRINSMY